MAVHRRKLLRGALRTRILFALMLILILAMSIFCFIEYRISPIAADAAKSLARTFATETVNKAVASAMGERSLVTVTQSENGISGIQTDIAALSAVRTDAVEELTRRINDPEIMNFSVPFGSLMGSSVFMGRGAPVKIRLVPIGDISADVRTEFIESGINQTLHKIVMRVRVTFKVLNAGETVKLELAADVPLAETVIVGKVPDAYTAINRFEIDEEEENDLNDYAATLP